MTNELMHYGILGMKWRIRRGAKKSKEFKEAKKAYKKANKVPIHQRGIVRYNAKNNLRKTYIIQKQKAAKNLARKGFDKHTTQRINAISLPKAIAERVVLGAYGAVKYNEFRSRGQGVLRSAVKGKIRSIVNTMNIKYMSGSERRDRKALYKAENPKKK